MLIVNMRFSGRLSGMEEAFMNRTYKAPPIIEAVIQVSFPDPLSAYAHKKIRDKMKQRYAHCRDEEKKTFNVDMTNGETQSVNTEPVYRLFDKNNTDILVLEQVAFTWSKLAPYAGWDEFFDRFSKEFSVIVENTNPRKPSRIGVRYINRIDIKNDRGEKSYGDYFSINISTPEILCPVKTYAWRFESDIAEGFTAIIQSAEVAPEILNTSAFVLDIDVVSSNNLPTKTVEILEKISLMRELKNKAFELSITEKARESFGL